MSEARNDAGSDILHLIADRWSPRAFADRAVAREILGIMLEAARWAASSYNEQPWRYIVATKENSEEYDRALGCLNEGNQTWAQTAPVLMFGIVSTRFARNDKPNRCAEHDLGLASANLTIEGMRHGVYVHQMAGIQIDKIREVYGVPEGFEPITGIAVGYPGEAEILPEGPRKMEQAARSRKPLTEIVFTGKWGSAADL